MLEGAEVVVDAHPTTLDEVIMIVLTLHLVHLFLIVLEDEKKRANTYLLQLLQFCEDSPLMYYLHSHYSKQICDIKVAKGSFIDSQQIDYEILSL